MLFNSYEFIFFFLPLTFLTYFYFLDKKFIRFSKLFLVLASLTFYSWWNLIYLPLILSSLIFNFLIGNILNNNLKRKRVHKKIILFLGIALNLVLLGYFKYSDFFIVNYNTIMGTSHTLLHIVLPLAISFFTFQQIAYLVDSYYQDTQEYDFLNYSLFVTFFPQLIAGPIVHHKEMMPQFENKYNFVKNYKNIALGLFIFSIGLFKKVVIADNFSVWANSGFENAYSLNMIEAWATSLSYTFQLYFDFSGYTDMAIGAALLFNIRLPINFNSPYKALNIQDFWKRWHITLSRFLRDYIYIPLGGNRKGDIKTYTNLIVTFFIGGLWHGAGWTFIVWGLLHGVALTIFKIYEKFNFTMPKFFAWFLTFNFINITWIFFRASDFQEAIAILSTMFIGKVPLDLSANLEHLNANPSIYGWIIAIFILIFFKNSIELSKQFKLNIYYFTFTLILFLTAYGELNEISEFLYFNF